MFLVASLVSLALGPMLYHMGRSSAGMLEWLEGFVVAAIGTLVLVEILPQAFQASGWTVVGSLAVGLLVPPLSERLMRSISQAHAIGVGLALLGVAIHALLDGAALAVSDTQGLPLAVILHRLPVGLMIWWLLAPMFGLAAAALVLVMAATVAGYVSAPQIASGLPVGSFGHVQAFIAGMLLHVLAHRHPEGVDHEHAGHRHSLPEEFRLWLTPLRVLGMMVGFGSVGFHALTQ